MVYRTINFKITGQVKDETDGNRTANLIKAKLEMIAAQYNLDIEGEIGF